MAPARVRTLMPMTTCSGMWARGQREEAGRGAGWRAGSQPAPGGIIGEAWANGAAAASGSSAVVVGRQARTRALRRQTLKMREAVVNPGDLGGRSCQGWLYPFHRVSLPGARLSGWGWRLGTGAAMGRGSARSLGMEVNLQYRVATSRLMSLCLDQTQWCGDQRLRE